MSQVGFCEVFLHTPLDCNKYATFHLYSCLWSTFKYMFSWQECAWSWNKAFNRIIRFLPNWMQMNTRLPDMSAALFTIATRTSVAPCLLKSVTSSSFFSVNFLCRINWRCFCYGSLGCNLEKDMELRALTLKWNLIIQTFVSFRDPDPDPESSVVDFGNSWSNLLEM